VLGRIEREGRKEAGELAATAGVGCGDRLGSDRVRAVRRLPMVRGGVAWRVACTRKVAGVQRRGRLAAFPRGCTSQGKARHNSGDLVDG
jgi:hypothetical protein